MKKIIFAAMAACGFVFVNAQSPQTSNASISVTLQDAMEITAPTGGYSVTYANANDYNTGTQSLGSQSWGIKSTKAGHIDVSLPATLSDGTNSYAFALSSSPAAGLSAGNFVSGPSNSFSLSISANVPWGFAPAGTYTGQVTVTFTQD